MATTKKSASSPSFLFTTFFSKVLLALFLLVTTVPTGFSADAETLSLATKTTGLQSVVVYSAKPIPTPSEVPIEIWLAANDKLSSFFPHSTPKQYATRSWPQTVVLNGLTLEVDPGQMPTLKPFTPSKISATTSAHPTSAISTTTHVPGTTSSATTHDGGGVHFASHLDRNVAIVVGVGLCLIALALLLVIMGLLWRRKNSTGSFFKPARYSLSSTMTEPPRPRAGGESWMTAMGPRQIEKTRPAEHDDAAPSPTVHRVSMIRAVDLSSSGGSRSSIARSTGRRRSRPLFPSGMWTAVKPSELEGDHVARAELPAEWPKEKAVGREINSIQTIRPVVDKGDGETTTKARDSRPLVVTISPSTSSSGMLGSRDGQNTSSSGLGESRDTITPIVTHIPSYRDRRPADLHLPSAQSRFRDERLAPLVYVPEDQALSGVSPPHRSPPAVSPPYRSPGVSPLYRNSVLSPSSPNFRMNGISRSNSPRFPERRVSPLIHYPSSEEVLGFQFAGGGTTPHRPSYSSLTDGGDGWQPNGDRTFGRYEMA